MNLPPDPLHERIFWQRLETAQWTAWYSDRTDRDDTEGEADAVLLRQVEGLEVLSDIDVPLLRRVLDCLTTDHVEPAVRSGADLRRLLTPQVDADALRRLLQRLAGKLLRFTAAPPTGRRADVPEARPSTPPSPRLHSPTTGTLTIQLLGQGPFTAALAKALTRQPFVAALRQTALDDDLVEVEEGSDEGSVAVVIGEDCSYAAVRRCQELCLEAGRSSLYFGLDIDGVRLGPLNLPGLSPCWGCAQISLLAAVGGDAPTLCDAANNFFYLGAYELPAPRLDLAARHLIAALERLADPTRRPSLLGRLHHFSLSGRDFEPAVEHSPDCPLCRLVEPPETHGHAQPASASSALVQRVEESPTLVCSEAAEVQRVAVLGGGTAGYLCALALRRYLPHLKIALIASSRHPVIGVGEATTPLMPQFLHADLELDVDDFFATVQPTLKLGIDFHWGPQPEHCFSYPFGPLRPLESLTYDGHLRHASWRSMAMAAGKISLLADGPRLPDLGSEVAYHLDNRRLVDFLEGQARKRGVQVIDAEIVDAELGDAGRYVDTLRSRDGRALKHDLYLDCSGFQGVLINRTLRSPWVSFGNSLLTDRAWVTQRPHDGTEVPPFTRATAMSHGWCWNTPQRHADHLGYVFASAFVEPQEAADELLRLVPEATTPRLVSFTSGRRQHMRQGNVVALGNAYGFVEPLESTALHMLLRQLGWLIEGFPRRRIEAASQAALNRRSAEAWDYVHWFLALHFRFQTHYPTPFWQACRETADISLHHELVEHFQAHGPLAYDQQLHRTAPAADPLWGLAGIDQILLGQGLPCPLPKPRMGQRSWRRYMAARQRLLLHSSEHAEALDRLAASPELRRALAGSFVDRGPAMGPRRSSGRF